MATSDSLWVGIDAGTQNVRTLVVSSTGELRGYGSAPVTSIRRGPRHEQDPRSWWDALAVASRQALASVNARAVRGLAVAGTSGTVLLVDQDGEQVTPGLMYDDIRAADYAQRVTDAGRDLWRRLGYKEMQPAWALPKLLWLLDRHGSSTGRLAHQSDYLAGRLAGHLVPADLSNALKTGADLINRSWPHDVMASLGVHEHVLPSLVRSGERIGVVGDAAAGQTGLPPGTPIVAGMTDGCAAQLAAGVVDVGDWSSVLGTTLVLKGVSDRLVTDPSGALYSHRSPDGSWLPGGASSSGAGAISRELAGRDLTALAGPAAQYEPSAVLAYPLASDRGERFPFVAPDARPFWLGTPHDDAERYASLIQGIGFVERLCFDHLTRLGMPVDGRRIVTGGAATSGYLTQLRADIMGRPVTVPEQTEAGTGMAVLAAAGEMGLRRAVAAMVRIASVVEPRSRTHDRFAEPYLRFVDQLNARGWVDRELSDQATKGVVGS